MTAEPPRAGPARTRVRLEVVEIPQPCPADWSSMAVVDGERVRFCRHCAKHVYNVSEMPRDAAERFLADRLAPAAVDPHLCVRMYKRADGTVVTADCRGRWRASIARWAARWGGATGAALSLVVAVGCRHPDRRGSTMMGTPPPQPQPIALGGVVCIPSQPSTQPAAGPAATQPVRTSKD